MSASMVGVRAECPGSRAVRDPGEAGEASVRESCWLDKLQLQHAPIVPAPSPLLVRVGAEAAPRPFRAVMKGTEGWFIGTKSPAVLAHRPGELSLDNAFTLIEGHPAIQNSLRRNRPVIASIPEPNSMILLGSGHMLTKPKVVIVNASEGIVPTALSDALALPLFSSQ